MKITEDPRFARLPKWAQTEAEHLERRVREAEKLAERARLATAPGESDTLLDKYDDKPIGLGTGTQVRFILREGKQDWRSYIDVRVERDQTTGARRLRLHGAEGLVLHPYISNVLHVDLTTS